MRRRILIVVLLICILTGCNESISSEDNGTSMISSSEELMNDNKSIIDVFPNQEGYVWFYEGPNDSEKVTMIQNADNSNDIITLTLLSCREDLAGEVKIEDRISSTIVEITKDSISIDDSVVLKAPLILGGKWETKYKIKPSKEEYNATIEIIELTEINITTKVFVSKDDNLIDENYEETVIYEYGKGILSEWYNIIGLDGYTRGLVLTTTYEKPVIPDMWYLTPYQIKKETEDN